MTKPARFGECDQNKSDSDDEKREERSELTLPQRSGEEQDIRIYVSSSLHIHNVY